MPPPPSFPVRLVAARALAPAVRELTFEREDGPLAFEPGQWLNLHVPLADGAIKRAYSIASPPDGTARFSLAVTRVERGAASRALHELPVGARLVADGPAGFFTRPADAGHPSLFVGTGTGLTPLRSMLLAAVARGATEPLWVLLGVRHEEDALYGEELRAEEARRPNVRLFVTLSRARRQAPRTGYVQAHVASLLGELGASGATPHLYVCGLERMVKAVRDVARKELGLERQRVHSERYD